MFNNDLTHFDKLIEYCIQDVCSNYTHCYPEYDGFNELFYIKEYHLLKKKIYKNIFSNNNIDDDGGDDINVPVASLKRFNYYDCNIDDGTILHHAVSYNFYYYCQSLLKDGFDQTVRS